MALFSIGGGVNFFHLKVVIVQLFMSISTLSLACPDLQENVSVEVPEKVCEEACKGPCEEIGDEVTYEKYEHSSNIEIYYPTSLEGVLSSLAYWSIYPIAWFFGVEGLLIMIPSKYPNGTYRSLGG